MHNVYFEPALFMRLSAQNSLERRMKPAGLIWKFLKILRERIVLLRADNKLSDTDRKNSKQYKVILCFSFVANV